MSTPRLELWKIEHSFANETHCHDDHYQITVPVYGTCAFQLENRQHALKSGEALIQFPSDRHSFHIGDGEGVIVLQVKRDIGELWELDRPWEPAMKQEVNGEELLRHYREWTMALCSEDRMEPGFIEETEAGIMAYLAEILQGNHSKVSAAVPRRKLPAGADPYLERVLEYMHDAYRKTLSVEELAALAGMSRFHFIRSFKAQTGHAPYQYLLGIRIEEARRLLRSTRLTVTEISLEVGFSSPSQLFRTFQKFTGMSPEQYRQH